MTFKVNDRVTLTKPYDGLPVGTPGTVTEIATDPRMAAPIKVKFDREFPRQLDNVHVQILRLFGATDQEILDMRDHGYLVENALAKAVI